MFQSVLADYFDYFVSQKKILVFAKDGIVLFCGIEYNPRGFDVWVRSWWSDSV
jgi:hypothetical protein